MLGTRSKWAVATVAWDVEFLPLGAESHHGLNMLLYANEKQNGGLNILNERYAAMACAADKFEERWFRSSSRSSMVVILTFMLLLTCQNKTTVDGDYGACCQNAKSEVEVHHSMCIESCISSTYNVSGPS